MNILDVKSCPLPSLKLPINAADVDTELLEAIILVPLSAMLEAVDGIRIVNRMMKNFW